MVVDEEVVIGADGREITRHPLMAPGEVSIRDEHYPGNVSTPTCAIRVRTGGERAFIALAGTSRLPAELADIIALELSWGREPLLAALARATHFRRFKAADVRSILQAGPSASNPVTAGDALNLVLPVVPVRPLADLGRQIDRLDARTPGRIERRRGVLSGKAVIAGTRIPTASIWRQVKEGLDADDVRQGYPGLTRKDIDAAVAFEKRTRASRRTA